MTATAQHSTADRAKPLQPMDNDSKKTMRGLFIFVGVVLAISGALTTVKLALSYGVTPEDKAVSVFLGLAIALGIATLLPASGYFWQQRNSLLAIVSLVLWLCTLPFSVFTDFSAFSDVQANRAAASIPAQQAAADRDAAQSKIDGLQRAAAYDISTLRQQAADIDARLRAERQTLANCPPRYFKACIDPSKARIETIRAELQPIQQRIHDYETWQAAQHEKRHALQRLANNGGAEALAPGFKNTGEILQVQGENVQHTMLLWMAVICEVLTAFFFFAAVLTVDVVMAGTGNLPAAGVARGDEIPALDSGGFITADGLALLHAGERVLNVAETREYLAWKAQTANPTPAVNTAPVSDSETAETPRNPGPKSAIDEPQPAGWQVGDWIPCALPECAGGFTVERLTPYNKKYCSTKCRVKGNGFASIDEVKRAVKRKRQGGQS